LAAVYRVFNDLAASKSRHKQVLQQCHELGHVGRLAGIKASSAGIEGCDLIRPKR
jgi:hypothetical protein